MIFLKKIKIENGADRTISTTLEALAIRKLILMFII